MPVPMAAAPAATIRCHGLRGSRRRCTGRGGALPQSTVSGMRPRPAEIVFGDGRCPSWPATQACRLTARRNSLRSVYARPRRIPVHGFGVNDRPMLTEVRPAYGFRRPCCADLPNPVDCPNLRMPRRRARIRPRAPSGPYPWAPSRVRRHISPFRGSARRRLEPKIVPIVFIPPSVQ